MGRRRVSVMPEALSGVIERVTFHNPENGYAVLRVQASGRRGLVTVVGNLPAVYAGEYLEGEGDWVQDRDHGLQFKADELRITPPHTREGIEKYLGVRAGQGHRPDTTPARSSRCSASGRWTSSTRARPSSRRSRASARKRIDRIRESWREQKAVRGIMVFLQSHGIGTARAVRIYKTYGDEAIEHGPRATRTAWRPTSGASASRRPTTWPAGWASTADSPLRARAAVRLRPAGTRAARATSASRSRASSNDDDAALHGHRRATSSGEADRARACTRASSSATRPGREASRAVAVPQAAVPRRARRRPRHPEP